MLSWANRVWGQSNVGVPPPDVPRHQLGSKQSTITSHNQYFSKITVHCIHLPCFTRIRNGDSIRGIWNVIIWLVLMNVLKGKTDVVVLIKIWCLFPASLYQQSIPYHIQIHIYQLMKLTTPTLRGGIRYSYFRMCCFKTQHERESSFFLNHACLLCN